MRACRVWQSLNQIVLEGAEVRRLGMAMVRLVSFEESRGLAVVWCGLAAVWR